MNQSSHALWWQAAPAANEASSECSALHREFVAKRQAAAAQLKVLAKEADQRGEFHLCEAALEDICGAQGDLAHWVWIFEMDERERSLFRNLQSEVMPLCAAAAAIDFDPSTNWRESFGLAACEPGHVGARRLARAGFLLQSLEWAKSAETSPFMVEGVAGGAETAELRGGRQRQAAWDRQPWANALADAYPELAAEGLFSNVSPAGAAFGHVGGARGAQWQKKKAESFARPRQPSLAAKTLFEALGRGLATPCECWPALSLRAWLESLELDASTQTPAQAPTPRL